MAYDGRCLDLAQYFLGCEGDDGDDMQASLAQHIQDAVEAWFGNVPVSKECTQTSDGPLPEDMK